METQNQKTRVLQVFGALVLGGAESRVMDIFRQLDPDKCTFDFVSMKPEKQYYEDEIHALGGKIYKIGFPREVGTLRNLKELRRCMREEKYDAVHAHTSYHCGVVMLAAWLEHIPVRIAHARTNGSRQKNVVKLLPLIFGRILISLFATNKIAISKKAGEYLFGHGNFEVIPNAINTECYQQVDEAKLTQYSNEFQILPEAIIIGHIGRFDAMKNHRFILECFAAFHKQNPNSILMLVGKGDLFEPMKEYVAQLGISQDVRFLGERSDVTQLIHMFDVLLFPSIFEGLGGVTIEAQAAGVPTVESDAIPIETDLGIGLVDRLSLSDDIQKWIAVLNSSLKKKSTDYDTIKSAFVRQGYEIRTVTEKYIEIYRGNA